MRFSLLALLSATFLSHAALADDTISPATAKAMEPIIHDYIMAHPEVIMEAIGKYQETREAAENKKKETFVKENFQAIYNDPGTASVGPKTAKNVVVEFFDYNCGACKVMFPALDKLIRQDNTLRVVFKEFPIFGERSNSLARIGHAVYRLAPEKYLDFHEKMMSFQGHSTELEALQFAKELGLEPAEVRKEAEKPTINEQIERDRALAHGIGAEGTPTLIVNGEIIGHALDEQGLKEKLTTGSAQ